MTYSRRTLLGLAPFAVFAAATARAAGESACYDPAKLPLGQRNRRRSLGYVEVSTTAGKTCGGCAFFTAATPASCGTCQLLTGGPVSAAAVCTSFAGKAR